MIFLTLAIYKALILKLPNIKIGLPLSPFLL